MKQLVLIAIAALTLTVQVGCAAIPSSIGASLSHAIRSSEEKGGPILVTGRGHMSLGFEQEKICDIQDRDVCAVVVPTESMLIHREAYNRTIVSFDGVVERFSEGGYCARECNYPKIRIVSVQAPYEIRPDRPKASVRAIDMERVVFGASVTEYQELASLAEKLFSMRGDESRMVDFFESFMTDGSLDAKTRKRTEWISNVIGRGAPSRRDGGALYHAVQIRDDLEPSKLSDDGLLCFCLYDSCNRSEARLDVMNQSISDATLCLPMDRSSGQWRFEREFFSVPFEE